MTDRFDIKAGEHGLVRVFRLDEPAKAAQARLEDGGAGLRALLGAAHIDPTHVDLFDTNDLGGLPLSAYLTDGMGIAEETLTDEAARLDAVAGPVVLVRSSAFGGTAQTLQAAHPLIWIGTYPEARAPAPLEGPSADSARGSVERQTAPVLLTRKGRGLLTLLVAALALTALVALLLAFGGRGG